MKRLDPAKSPVSPRTTGLRAEAATAAERWWMVLLAATAIVAAAIVVYRNSFAGVLLFDDRFWILNPSIQQLWPPSHWLFPETNAGIVGGRPVVSLTLALNYAFGRTDVWGYHAVNLAIHILAALTLFGLVRQTLRLPALRDRFGSTATVIALATALIWTVHPVQTAAVTYIIQRNESLVGLFYLLTLYCVVRGAVEVESGEWRVERSVGRASLPDLDGLGSPSCKASATTLVPLMPQASRLKPTLWYSAAVLACLLGMATKEVMATAPLVVLLYDRTFLSGSFRRAIAERWGLYSLLAATWGAIVWGLVSTNFHDNTTGFGNQDFKPLAYLLTQPGVLLHYLRLALWPAGLCIDYAWPAANSFNQIVWPGLAILALLVLTCWALVKRPALGFLGASCFLILAPTSSLVPIRDAAFEHRMYLPLAALTALAVLGGLELWNRLNATRAAGPRRANRTETFAFWPAIGLAVLFAAIVVALGATTVARNDDYRSGVAMWSDVVRKRPGNIRGHTNLAEQFLNEQGAEGAHGAIEQCQIALDIDPDRIDARVNLASALILIDELDRAEVELNRVLCLDAECAAAHNLLGTIFGRRGNYAEAVRCFRQAIEFDPKSFKPRYNLALALLKQEKFAEAIAAYRGALEINPGSADTRRDLGQALAAEHKFDEAAAEFRTVLESQPADAEAHFQLGRCLVAMGNMREAIANFRTAVRLQPNNAKYLNQAATALATCPDPRLRNGADAVAMAKGAVNLTRGQDPGCLAALAAAYAETRQFAAAVQVTRQAIVLADAQPNPPLAKQLREQLKSYQASLSGPEPGGQ